MRIELTHIDNYGGEVKLGKAYSMPVLPGKIIIITDIAYVKTDVNYVHFITYIFTGKDGGLYTVPLNDFLRDLNEGTYVPTTI